MMQCRPQSASPWRVICLNSALMALFRLILLGLFLRSSSSWSNFDGADSMHHLFNAHLLAPKEFQVSVFGNAQAGVTSDLELGVQGLGYVIQPPLWNFSLKHRMFTETNFQTSFNSHSFYFQSGADHLLMSLHGVITSYFVHRNHHFNFGLMDGLLMAFNRDGESSLHLVTPVLGWDGVINSHLGFSATLLRPIYAAQQQESQRFGEGNRRLDFTNGNAHPAFAMMSGILSFGSFHLELGAIVLSYESLITLPYANLFWRFHE